MSLFRRWLRAARTPTRPSRRTWLRYEVLEDRLAPAVNPIIAENLLPGTSPSEWGIVGTGDPNLQGFATNMSVDQGQTIAFKINDPLLVPYFIDIYRIGYYQGLGARRVATIPAGNTLVQNQPSPLFDPATRLVDAGNWSVSASWAVPSTAVSGVYIARLVRTDNGGASHIPFVVRDDDGQSDVLFQTSDTTWQAYNNWGGYSLYGGADGQRAYKVSYNRPWATRTNTVNGRDFFFGVEYAMVRWLESNGYNVSYISNVDTDRYGSELLEHKAFLSVGHDEYWSGAQRANVEAARDAGVNLAFFSGNEVYWKVRWENSIDGSGTTYRTMVCYKETQANAKIDPSPEWTGTWRDPRFSPPSNGGRPENALTGTIFTVNRGPGGETGTSFNVTADYSGLRFWRNTSVAALTTGQTAVLGDQVLGYEWDEDLDNGFRPAGLIPMSSTTQTVPQKLLDFGSTVGIGVATHSLSLYRAQSGAMVFGAGTVQWAWGLDGTHDGPITTPDPAMRQATVNLLADMGVQPGSLQPGQVPASMSTDVVAPTSAFSNVTPGQIFTLGTAFTINGTATDSAGVVAVIEVSTDGGQSWRRATGRTSWSYVWTPNSTGPVSIQVRAVDDSANMATAPTTVNVTVVPAAVSTAGLVAAYGFNEGSGSTLGDSSGTGNSGSISGATWTTAGLFGNALSFDGVNDRVNINDSASLDLTTGMTMEAWVRPSTLNDFKTVILKERQTNDLAYALYASDGANGPPSVYTSGGALGNSIGGSVLPLNTWSHLAATFDGTTLRLYVNGTLTSSQTVLGSIIATTNPLRIGGNAVWGEYFTGLIDEVRIYNRALSEGELRTDMSTPVGGTLEAVAPSASITSPAAGATVSGVVNVAINASDNVGVAGVRLLVDGQPTGAEDTVTPYSISWNTNLLANGTHALAAQVRDFAGNSFTTSSISVTVSNAADTIAPVVDLNFPDANQRLSGTAVAWAVATDNVGVVGVKLKLNGSYVGTEDTAAPYGIAYDTTTFADGSYSLVAEARDAAGNVTSTAPVTVIIDNTAPSITARDPGPGATGIGTNTNVSVTFSEDILLYTPVFELRDSANTLVPSAVSYNGATRTLSLNPNLDLNLASVYTVSLSGVRDLAGNLLPGTTTWSFTTSGVVLDATLWAGAATPTVTSANDTSSVELGVKFQANISGYITGIRFYKGTLNTGTHVGHLWDSAGTLLGSVTFTGETASGWQQANFATPIAISANTTYVASYYAPNGGYSVDASYFVAAYDTGRLKALASGPSGGNGVYRYVTGGGFPTNEFQSSNYWVDPVFSSVIIVPPTVADRSPAPGATSVPVASNVTATFSESVQPATIVFTLRDPTNNLVSGTATYVDGTRTVTFDPTANLAQGVTYTASLSGALDLDGNVMTPVTWSFTTFLPDTVAPVVVSRTPAPSETGVAPRANVLATFNETIQFVTVTFQLKNPANVVIAGKLTYNDVTHALKFDPTIDLDVSTTYTATLSGAQDLSGNTMTTLTWSFTTDVAVTNASLWNNSTTPAIPATNDLTAIELGMKFTASKDGYISGVRFYKGAANTGTHVGHLWDTGGNQLATVTFTNESATGWQQASFPSPVAITAGATYVVSYYAPNGAYAANGGYFSSAFTNGVLQGLASGASGGNGVYRYGLGGGFPNNSFNSTNYWVDVVYTNTIADLTPPTVIARSPATGATNVSVNAFVTAQFSEAVLSGTITFQLRDPSNNLVNATVSYDGATRVATLIPSTALGYNTTYTATVSGVQDLVGNAMTSASTWSFTTGTAVTNATLWGSTTPAVAAALDPAAIEVGLKFRSSAAGFVTGIRFYKGSTNTGTHVGHLWDVNGNLLATVTFTGETQSGWQQMSFAVPVAIAANATYVSSVYMPNGGYSYNHGYFDGTGFSNDPITALANGENGGNGVYRYGAGGGYPTDSFNSTNYWIDVIYSDTLGDTTAPTVTAKAPANNAVKISPYTNVTATFSEGVQAPTIVFELRDASNNLIGAAVTYDSATNTVTLDPTAVLASRQWFTATLSGAKDPSGNMMSSTSWTFKTAAVWKQSTAGDFSAGTLSGLTISEDGDGALRLVSNFEDLFSGTSLSSSWSTTSWTPQGGGATNVTVSGGRVSIEGAQVLTVNAFPGKGVEGSVSFAATPYQHFGLATGLDQVSGRYWAIFSTGGTNNKLYARVNSSGTMQDVDLGALPAGFHTYKVRPVASGFEFYVDNVLKTTINITFPGATATKIAFSAFNGAPALQCDWVRLTDYNATGTFTSATFDAGSSVTWDRLEWTHDTPAGTSITVEIAVSSDGTNWSSWAAVTNGTTLSGVTGRYFRYRVTLSTTILDLTPIFYGVDVFFE